MCSRLLIVVVLAACGGSGAATPDAPGGGDAGEADAPAPDGASCAADRALCDQACVDVSTDPLHCGVCNHACTGESSSCQRSMCVPELVTSWEVHFGGGSVPGFWFSALASDAAGNVYVAGVMNGVIDLGGGPLTIGGPGGGASDLVVASFSATGAHRWSRVFGSEGIDAATGVVLVQDTLYVLGTFQRTVDFGGGPLTSDGARDVVVLGLDAATGGYASARRYGNAQDDEAFAITADGRGNVIIGGAFHGASIDVGGGPISGNGTFLDGWIAAFSATGGHVWSRAIATVPMGNHAALPAALVADAQGNVVVTGDAHGTVDFGAGTTTTAGSDAYVASYTAAGALRWVHTYGGAGDDRGTALAIDSADQVYVGGTFHGPAADFGLGPVATTATDDGFVVALTGDAGATRFARALGASATGSVSGIAASSDGTLAVTGGVGGELELGIGPTEALGNTDLYLASFAGDTGASRWGKRYGGRDFDAGLAIARGPRGEVLIAGQTFSNPIELGAGPVPLLGTVDNGFVLQIVP